MENGVKLATVTIVGRPNVGKSTLFNRILRRRLAIVSSDSGITRDRNYSLTSWRGRDFLLVDTGGMIPHTRDQIGISVRTQAQFAIEESEVVIFLVDNKTGPVDLDFQIAKLLFKKGEEVILTVNKVDNPGQEPASFEFMKLGLGEPLPLSATAGKNIGTLLDRVVEKIPPTEKVGIEEEELRIAVLGRPNVGKSSLVNAIYGRERVIVDSRPGTTRDSIDTVFHRDGQSFILVDTAGLRRRWKITTGIEYYSTLRAFRSLQWAQVALVLVDAYKGITNQDLKILSLVESSSKGLVVVTNKWDLVIGRKRSDFELYFQERATRFAFAPLVFTSAIEGMGVRECLDWAKRVQENRKRKLATRVLNRRLQEWTKANPPSSHRGREIKLLYLVQTDQEPPSFTFFSNYPQDINKNYIAYLSNQMRRDFDLQGAPIKLKFRHK
jgi:GTP-binding protein